MSPSIPAVNGCKMFYLIIKTISLKTFKTTFKHNCSNRTLKFTLLVMLILYLLVSKNHTLWQKNKYDN